MFLCGHQQHRFLSCLCGSEQNHYRDIQLPHFLSCLCGSELKTETFERSAIFLSCLCGSEQAFRRWLTIEAGWFEVYETPGGIRKEPMSISFKNMEQEQFNAFYKSCFDVCWNMLLQHKFTSEEEAQEAVETMMRLGN